MKTILNIIIAVLIYIIYCDIENNITNPELNYSNSIVSLAGILFFGFFRLNWDAFINHLNKK